MKSSCHTVKGRPAAYRTPMPDVTPDAARRMIAAAMAWLSGGQQALLRARYWHGRTVEEVAGTLAVTADEARRLEAAALLVCRQAIAGLFDPETGEAQDLGLPA